MKDDRDKRIFAAASGKYIFLLLGAEDEASARKVFLLIDQQPSDSKLGEPRKDIEPCIPCEDKCS
jgi:hypothetical protein